MIKWSNVLLFRTVNNYLKYKKKIIKYKLPRKSINICQLINYALYIDQKICYLAHFFLIDLSIYSLKYCIFHVNKQ